ncbi:MAG TPA: glycerate kinase, partial [Gammaproteobacteria bacterium]|nr:glycerate kinase [Gammaproteobacteria bacterium]
GKLIDATYLFCKSRKLAIIESATAAGLALLKPADYDPMHANTFGVGQLIHAALNEGSKQIILGLGGSATNDAGTGLAHAMGFRFLDNANNEITPCGANLSRITHIDTENIDPRLATTRLEIACDVSNPLLGQNGAINVYGPQKGATRKQIALLEQGFQHFARVLECYYGKPVSQKKGAGAAGGLGAGMMALFNGCLKSGADLLLDLLEFEKLAADVDLIITSEGKLDTQTQFGKAPYVLAQRAANKGIPCIVIAGQVEGNYQRYYDMGFSEVFSLCSNTINPDRAMKEASKLLSDTSKNIASLTHKNL